MFVLVLFGSAFSDNKTKTQTKKWGAGWEEERNGIKAMFILNDYGLLQVRSIDSDLAGADLCER